MKKFLKRFEKLEGAAYPKETSPRTMAATKRFERLEINDRKIEVSISDRQAKEESAPAGTLYYRMCAYCGAENLSDARECVKCRHPLGDYAADYGGKEGQLKKCICGAVNLKDRKFCWVCGRDFTLWGDEQVEQKQQNVVIINIDGKTYRSDDPNLPPGIVALMEKIRRQGYSKELIDEWIKQSNEEHDLRREEIQRHISGIRFNLRNAVLLFLLLAVLVFLQIQCGRSFLGF